MTFGPKGPKLNSRPARSTAFKIEFLQPNSALFSYFDKLDLKYEKYLSIDLKAQGCYCCDNNGLKLHFRLSTFINFTFVSILDNKMFLGKSKAFIKKGVTKLLNDK